MGKKRERRLKQYTLHGLIGEGDIGRVYRATNRISGQQVALKVFRADSPVAAARSYFENEGFILAQVDHPAIPTLYEFLDGRWPGLAMTLIDGKDGEAILAETPSGAFLEPERVLRWGIQIAAALGYLHGHCPSIAFRDLKPAHILIDGQDEAWLVDFNLAKALPPSGYLANADAIGTEGFAPPEQYEGVVSPLVDVYALGATLHQLLTRRDPRLETRFVFEAPHHIHPGVPEMVSRVIMKALAYEPGDRYQTMREMEAALRQAGENSTNPNGD
ncbi:MAG: serine/threonine protein kinase [Anaerolineae bacterium]|nr:serine/threonine protein kinase [Anaerolineae bacterium]